MFLDDKLIKICLDARINQSEDVQQTYNKLVDTCQDHYKTHLVAGMKKSNVKSLIDQTFYSWNSFVRMALKHNNNQVRILGRLCEIHTFKNTFMKDQKLSDFYKTL